MIFALSTGLIACGGEDPPDVSSNNTSTNGDPNSEPNGSTNGEPNGSTNGEPNSEPNGSTNGDPNSEPNGSTNGSTNGEPNSEPNNNNGECEITNGGVEICDGIDNDCDGEIDEDAEDGTTRYEDSDGDGWGNEDVTIVSCQPVEGFVDQSGDCNDTDAAINPDADEVCDGVDNNCDGNVDPDDAIDVATWYVDADGDGYGEDSSTTMACEQPNGYAAMGGDCNDTDAAINPAADEVCDGVDNNCDGNVDPDDAVDASTWYADTDGDSYGDDNATTTACDQPNGYVAMGGDCNDMDAAINPDADEVCDGVDNNCDGNVDPDSAIDASTWYADTDGDGYGDDNATTTSCNQPNSYVAIGGDCNDADAAINPDADEVCDGVDNNCDGNVDPDDAIDASTWYADSDADGFGDDNSTTTSCNQPNGYVADGGDCDDTDDTVYPDAPGLCDGKDNDCNGLIDDVRLVSTVPHTFTVTGTAGDGATPPDTMATAADDGFCIARGSGGLLTRTIRFTHVDSTGANSTHNRSFSGGGDFQILDVKWTGTSCLALAREQILGGVGTDTTYALQLFRWEPDTTTILDMRVDDDGHYPDDDPQILNAAMKIVSPSPGCSLLCLDRLHIAYVQNDPADPSSSLNRLVYRETVPNFPATAGIMPETVITSVVGNRRVTMGPSPEGDHEWLVMSWNFGLTSTWQVHSGPAITERVDLEHASANFTDPHIGSFSGTPYLAIRDLGNDQVLLKEISGAYEYRFETAVDDVSGGEFETRSLFADNIRQSTWQTIDTSGPFPITTTWSEIGWFLQPYSDDLARMVNGLVPEARQFSNPNMGAGDELLAVNKSGSYLQVLRMYSQDPFDVAIDEFTCY